MSEGDQKFLVLCLAKDKSELDFGAIRGYH